MNDPLKVLGLEPGADDAAVRRRYLELVRQFPPDRAPERFAEVRAAYEKLQDPILRMEAMLFDVRSGEDLTRIAADARVKRLEPAQIPLRKVLRLVERP